jgi:hypothetical protein
MHECPELDFREAAHILIDNIIGDPLQRRLVSEGVLIFGT